MNPYREFDTCIHTVTQPHIFINITQRSTFRNEEKHILKVNHTPKKKLKKKNQKQKGEKRGFK